MRLFLAPPAEALAAWLAVAHRLLIRQPCATSDACSFLQNRALQNAVYTCVSHSSTLPATSSAHRQIAAENNLSETAFIVAEPDDKYRLRWFTPTVEVDMCGHATLATAALILERLQPTWPSVSFLTRSGDLSASRRTDTDSNSTSPGGGVGPIELTMDFPLWPASETASAPPSSLVAAIGASPAEAFSIPPLHGGAPYWLFYYQEQASLRASLRRVSHTHSWAFGMLPPHSSCLS